VSTSTEVPFTLTQVGKPDAFYSVLFFPHTSSIPLPTISRIEPTINNPTAGFVIAQDVVLGRPLLAKQINWSYNNKEIVSDAIEVFISQNGNTLAFANGTFLTFGELTVGVSLRTHLTLTQTSDGFVIVVGDQRLKFQNQQFATKFSIKSQNLAPTYSLTIDDMKQPDITSHDNGLSFDVKNF